MSKSKPLILTAGDPDGVGAEIIWKTIKKKNRFHICLGSEKAFAKVGAKIKLIEPAELNDSSFLKNLKKIFQHSKRPFIALLPAPNTAPKNELFLKGYQSGWAIERAVELVQKGVGSAIVTAPISKDRLIQGGYNYDGHTSMLKELSKSASVTMMLANNKIRVSLVTTHIPLDEVPRNCSREKIRITFENTYSYLKNQLGISKPKIAILGLNPHAGENGRIGKHDLTVIWPEFQSLQKDYKGKAHVSGVHASDAFFAKEKENGYPHDAIIAMYHDQGLIPVKLLDFGRTVNISLGLPLIRTSVDHGVAFDIAGKGIANESSMIAAIRLAKKLVKIQKSKNRGAYHGH